MSSEADAASEEAPTGSEEIPAVASEAPAESAEEDAEESSEDAEARLQAIREAMVLVTVRINGENYTEPGVVLHRHADQAFVVARQCRELSEAFGRPENVVAGPDFVVLCGQGSQRQAVPGQLISALAPQSNLCVVGAPADRLPPPIPLDGAAEPTPQMPVHVIGVEEDRYARPRGYALFAEEGSVCQIDRNREGKITLIEIKCPEAPTLSCAVVASTSGRVVGFSTGQRTPATGDPFQYRAGPATTLTRLLEPQVAFFDFGFESGDTKQVVYEFVAVLNNPLQRISSPKVSIRPQSVTEYLAERPGNALPPGEEPPPIDTLPDAKTLALENRAPSEAFVRQFPTIKRFGAGHAYVARFTAPNPGPQQMYVFQGQLSYLDQSGKKIYFPPQTLAFRMMLHQGDEAPTIPGI